MSGLVKRVPVFQASMGSNPMKGSIVSSGKGSVKQSAPHFQAPSGKSLVGSVNTGSRTPKSRTLSMPDVQKITQKAGLTNQGYGV